MTSPTAKAERTRSQILNTALGLFSGKGFEATTMRDIAAKADVSLGLAYRYFESKESLLLSVYQQMADQTDAAISDLAPGEIGNRFAEAMKVRLGGAASYRQAFGALFGAIMTPGSRAALLGSGAAQMRAKAEHAFIHLVERSSDAPKPAHAKSLGKLLYIMHFAIILFWLHDRSEHQKSTHALLAFIRRGLLLLSPSMHLPLVASQITRLVRIIEGVF
jgi:AcrR family transcriptional regulator